VKFFHLDANQHQGAQGALLRQRHGGAPGLRSGVRAEADEIREASGRRRIGLVRRSSRRARHSSNTLESGGFLALPRCHSERMKKYREWLREGYEGTAIHWRHACVQHIELSLAYASGYRPFIKFAHDFIDGRHSRKSAAFSAPQEGGPSLEAEDVLKVSLTLGAREVKYKYLTPELNYLLVFEDRDGGSSTVAFRCFGG